MWAQSHIYCAQNDDGTRRSAKGPEAEHRLCLLVRDEDKFCETRPSLTS